MQYLSLSEHLKAIYGQKIYKLSLSSGCTCPNRDGHISTGGCIFCSEGGSGDFAAPFLPIPEQIRIAREKVEHKIPASIPHKDRKFIAYFQSYTNTYGDPNRLRRIYMETICRDEIVGMSIGTRPDCLPDEILELLSDLNAIKPVWVELGLQTIHESTATYINRGYSLDIFHEAYRKLRGLGITVIVHTILGLPGETRDDMLDTMRYLSALSPSLQGIKLHLLHVMKGTPLGRSYPEDPFPLPTLSEYADLVADCLRILPESTVIHRMTGDAPRSLLIAPTWSCDKKRVLNTLRKVIADSER